MSTAETPTAHKTPPRGHAAITADLAEAREQLKKLMPLVEADRTKVARRQARIAAAMAKWKVERPEDPFDPEEFSPPLVPIPFDDALHGAFHKAHYVVADLEQELDDLKPVRRKAGDR